MKELLEALRDVVASLSSEGVAPETDGRIAFILPFLSISMVSESKTIYVPLLALFMSLPLLYEVYRKGGTLRLKSVVLVTLFASVVALPLLPYQPQGALVFIVKVTACSALFLGSIGYVGWPAVANGIERIVGIEDLSNALRLTLINSYVLINELMKLIMARSARQLNKGGYRSTWKAYSRSVGALLEKAYEKSRRVEMAFTARDLGGAKLSKKGKVSPTLLFIHSIVIIVGLMNLVGIL